MSNEEMNDIMEIVQALEDFNILLKGVTKTIKSKRKDQKGGGTLGASLLGNMLGGKGIVRAGSGKGIVRGVYGNEMDFNGASSFNKL